MKRSIFLFVIAFIALYAVGAFVSLEVNLLEWGKEWRFILVFSACLTASVWDNL